MSRWTPERLATLVILMDDHVKEVLDLVEDGEEEIRLCRDLRIALGGDSEQYKIAVQLFHDTNQRMSEKLAKLRKIEDLLKGGES